MAAMVLNSPRAVAMGIQVVRTFVRLRQMFAAHAELAFDAIRKLTTPLETPKRRIGFHGYRG